MNDPRMDKVGPVDHITRAVLPWRTGPTLTECGKPVAKYEGRLVTREEAAARIARIGKARAAFTLCMTCAETSDRHQGDAVAVVARETSSVQHATPPIRYPVFDSDMADRHRRWQEAAERQWAARQRLNAEFEAIAALVAAHREEFDGYLAGRAEAVSLDEQRRRRRRVR